MLTTLRALAAREPVRLYLYGLLLALIGAGVARGVVSDDLAVALEVVLPALLAVPAVERARSRVTPCASSSEPCQIERLDDPAADPGGAADVTAVQ